MNRGRLCYLYTVRDDDDYELEWGDRNGYSTWYNLLNHSKAKPGMLLSTVLERDEETCMIVLSFLKTL